MSRLVVPPGRAPLPDPGRRRFVQGLAWGGAALGVGLLPRFALAAPAAGAYPAVLSGTEFHLRIGDTPVNFTGRPRVATAVNGQVPAPILRWREGDTVTLHVHNAMPVSSSIHWHGILLPFRMDGVPGLSFPGIALAPAQDRRRHLAIDRGGHARAAGEVDRGVADAQMELGAAEHCGIGAGCRRGEREARQQADTKRGAAPGKALDETATARIGQRCAAGWNDKTGHGSSSTRIRAARGRRAAWIGTGRRPQGRDRACFRRPVGATAAR